MPTLPPGIDDLVTTLAAMPGVVAVSLGGSRANGSDDAKSDWDLGVYYRGALDTTALAARGEVHPPGSWGRIMNGGAWLSIAGVKVDVLLRDLDAVEHWSRQADQGAFEIDALLGYLAGAPTYNLLGERAVGVVLRGELPRAPHFPDRLRELAPARWAFCARFTVDYARMLAARGDVVGTLGQLAKGVFELGHSVLSARGEWALNEKRLVKAAGLDDVAAALNAVPRSHVDLPRWVDEVAEVMRRRLEESASGLTQNNRARSGNVLSLCVSPTSCDSTSRRRRGEGSLKPEA